MLNLQLNLPEILAAYQQRPSFRQRDAPLPIHQAYQSLGNTSPQVNGQRVAGSDHVVRPDGEIHGNHVGLTLGITEYVEAEALGGTLRNRSLYVHVVERGDIGVWVCRAHHLYGRCVLRKLSGLWPSPFGGGQLRNIGSREDVTRAGPVGGKIILRERERVPCAEEVTRLRNRGRIETRLEDLRRQLQFRRASTLQPGLSREQIGLQGARRRKGRRHDGQDARSV